MSAREVRVDYEYERNGTANMFMMFAPLEGWLHVKVTERRTATDYVQALKDLSDVHHCRVATGQRDRNRHHAKADWHFTTEKARVKLKYLYPSL
jgi:hypothetical protein